MLRIELGILGLLLALRGLKRRTLFIYFKVSLIAVIIKRGKRRNSCLADPYYEAKWRSCFGTGFLFYISNKGIPEPVVFLVQVMQEMNMEEMPGWFFQFFIATHFPPQ